MVAGISDAEVAALSAAVVAVAVPLNTFFLILLARAQKRGNHHTETIRQLSAAISGEQPSQPMPPEEVGERVVDAINESKEGK